MNEKALRVLEYPKIIEQLVNHAGSEPGKRKCRSLEPSTDITEIRRMQQETSDALRRIYAQGSLSFSGLIDMRESVRRLEIGSTLNTVELLRIARLLETTGIVKNYDRADKLERPDDSLDQMFRELEPLVPLMQEIRRCILDEDEIADNASPGLQKVRRAQLQANDRIRTTLQQMVNGSTRAYLQEAVITQRDGRYCLPVKAEYRSNVAGMVHDQSSTGATLFIEPMAVVKLNNDIRELQAQEKKEIEAVLASLSNQVSDNSGLITSNIVLLTELDFIFARASLAKSYNGYEPEFNTDGIVDIRKGRHPMLDKHKVVPIDIRIGSDFDLLVISGPNTGGKTVSLKTVGLFTLMGQSGLFIPAAEHSQLALFTEVFADIGDEQSIEQSLSTFSSHMTNIVDFWERADENSLILFDELGAGTDPEEGAALAISILDNLHRRGIRTIATTHYSEVKLFALSTVGVENACCEFNVETLRPTYRLMIGVPGKSNAFAISKRLGLPDEIIEEARTRISTEEIRFEDVVSDLEHTRKSLEAEREEVQRLKDEAEQIRKNVGKSQTRLDENREKMLANAREEAQKILREAKEYADQTIRTYNKLSSGKDTARAMEQERTKLRDKMSQLESANAKAPKKPSQKLDARKLHLGDSVKVLSLNLSGTVSTLPDAKGNLFVQMGILRSQVNISDLEFLEEAQEPVVKQKKSGAGKIRMSKSFSVSTEINLLGKTKDEAINELDKYLDDAYVAHLPSVRIVHGKGTGALRQAVHQYLRRQKHVKEFRLGEYGEGDAGVTIVTFK